MAGVKGRSGGRRSGAGTRTAAVNDRQASFRTIVMDSVPPERWAGVITKALEQAEGGDGVARSWLGSYLMGAPPREISGQVDGDGRFLFVIE